MLVKRDIVVNHMKRKIRGTKHAIKRGGEVEGIEV